MTKKSLARQERDRIAKGAKPAEMCSWDEVNDLGRQCANLIAQDASIAQLGFQPQLVQHVADPAQLAKNLRVLSTDLRTLHTELKMIRETHADRSGVARDVDDNMTAIGVHEKYVLWFERHSAIVAPISTAVAAQFSDAEQRLSQAQQSNMTAEQDPSIVTDVEVKVVEDTAKAVN